MSRTQRHRGGLGAALLAAGISLAAAPPLLAQTSTAAHQQFLFGYKLLQRGDDRLAAEAFDQYLGSFPNAEKRGDGIYYRALLYHRAGDDAQAAQLLADVPAPKLVPVYAIDLLRGQVLSDLKRYDEALAALERIDVSGLKPKVAASVHYLRGLAYRGADNLPAAAKSLQAAGELDSPIRARALLDLARVQTLLNQRGQAIATLKQSLEVAAGPIAAEAARLAGDLAQEQGDYEQAAAFYSKVVAEHQSSPHFAASALGLMWSHYSAGRYEQLQQTFDQYRDLLPEDQKATAFYLVGSGQQALGHHEQAVAMLKSATQRADGGVREKALYKLATSQFELGQYDAMRQTLATLEQQFPNSPLRAEAAYLLATADAKQGDVTAGAARLTELIDQGQAYPYYASALLQRARLYDEHGRVEPAIEDYRAWLATNPLTVKQGDGKRFDPNRTQVDVFLRLLNLLTQQGQHQAAATLAQQWLEHANLSAEAQQAALFRLAMAQIKLNQADAALATLQTLQDKHSLNPYRDEANYYRGLLLMSQGQTEQAIPVLLEVADQPGLDQARRVSALRLVAVEQRNADDDAAVAGTLTKLEALAGQRNLNAAEQLWLGRSCFVQGDFKKAAGYLDTVARQGTKPIERTEALYLLGQMHRQQNELDAAIKAFQQVVAIGAGFDLDARLRIAQTLADMQRGDEALAELSGLVNSERSDIAAEALFTSSMIHRQRALQRKRQDDAAGAAAANDEAQRLLKRMVLLYPFEQLTPLPQLAYISLAEIAGEQGDAAAAQGYLEELVEKFPDGGYATYAKAALAVQRDRLGEATALLKRLQGSETMDPRLAQRVQRMLKELESRT